MSSYYAAEVLFSPEGEDAHDLLVGSILCCPETVFMEYKIVNDELKTLTDDAKLLKSYKTYVKNFKTALDDFKATGETDYSKFENPSPDHVNFSEFSEIEPDGLSEGLKQQFDQLVAELKSEA
ncbi:MAG: hypothetical protein COB24_11260 [Hyphomicrobiales bacterium]|nr:MAG: hypothetical protein COB24_11260 [Hyphomicrobiales bacterium]